MLDRYHMTSIGPDEEALRAAFMKCGDSCAHQTAAHLPLALGSIFLRI